MRMIWWRDDKHLLKNAEDLGKLDSYSEEERTIIQHYWFYLVLLILYFKVGRSKNRSF
jgi:hypothetical protein